MKNKVVMTDIRKEDRMYQESIKNLRTSLLFSGVNTKVILMTSSFPNEGKSDVSFQLSRELGNISKKVLFLDADIRKSTMVTRYSVEGKIKGLSHYLSGQAGLDEVICETNYENVDIVFAGSLVPNPTELLETDLMRELLEKMRDQYDYVIIDTPPLASMSDSLIVGKWCDGAIIVIEAGRVSYRIAQRVKQKLVDSGCKVLGAVLNKIDTTDYHYYGYYGKKYGYYGKKYGYYGKKDGYYGYYGPDTKEGESADK
ncbi:MAG: CpsD/CapB family tyrosine-protein kinase [Lachnospiraceae bacterium]|nr:CpsD/CapB family tyrosine-protein kinase [Lachnospiraceae bacterium]